MLKADIEKLKNAPDVISKNEYSEDENGTRSLAAICYSSVSLNLSAREVINGDAFDNKKPESQVTPVVTKRTLKEKNDGYN